LKWNNFSGPGMKPLIIQPYSTPFNGWQMPGVPERKPNPSYYEIKKAFRPVGLFFREKNRSFYEKTRVQRSLSVFNDLLGESNFLLIWEVKYGNKTLISSQKKFKSKAGNIYRTPISFTTPRVKAKTNLKLKFTLLRNKKIVHRETLYYSLYPRAPLQRDKRIAFYGDGLLGDIYQRVTDFKHLSDYKVLVIGNDLKKPLEREECEEILRFVREGGSLLVLEQSKFPLMFFETFGLRMEKASSEIVRIQYPGHPILRNISGDDLAFWGDGTIGEDASRVINDGLLKPIEGNFRIILDFASQSFHVRGVKWAALLESFPGKGNIIFCQVNIGKYLNSNPICAKLFDNMLDYLLRNGQLKDKEKSYPLTIWQKNKDTEVQKAASREVRDFVKQGGVVLINRVSPSDINNLNMVLPQRISLQRHKSSQLIKMGNDNLLSSLCNDDLFWLDENSDLMTYGIEPGRNITGLIGTSPTNWINWNKKYAGEAVKMGGIEIDKAKYKKLFALCKISLGKGYFLLNQLNLGCDNSKAKRIHSILMTNLGRKLEKIRSEEPDKGKDFSNKKGYITTYLVSNPFATKRGRDPLSSDFLGGEETFLPREMWYEKGIEFWEQHSDGDVLDIGNCAKVEGNGVVYIHLYIYSPVSRCDLLWDVDNLVDLHIGSSGKFKVYVNGKLVKSQEKETGFKKDGFRLEYLRLQKGWNRLMIKVSKPKKEWLFSSRIINRNTFQPVADLRYSLSPLSENKKE